jgi:predicted transcriptional regulator
MEAMESLAELKILWVLYGRRLYTVDIHEKTGVSLRHVNNILPALHKRGMVKSYTEKNRKYYELTERGEKRLLDFFESNPDGLAALSGMEETAKVEGRVKPSLSAYIQGLRVVEQLNKFLPLLDAPSLPIRLEEEEIKKLREVRKILEKKLRERRRD